ncbi:MAG: 4Fe-4S dicluster domain-containing protein, partial [Anaerotignaceae bacterium]
MLKSMNFEKMKTNTSLCVGCNKCIFKCPTQANNAQLENGENKIRINNDLCIYCGECINICDHKARIINDDCKVFFDDL